MHFENFETQIVECIFSVSPGLVVLFLCKPADVLCEGQTLWYETRRLALVREVKNRY
jgi:hypothetical protein